MTPQMQICNVSNFVLSDEQEEVSWMNYTWGVLIHTLAQIKGSNEDDGK